MKPILEFLEALGVDARKGAAKMECPSCHELKLTASEKRNVASCWACGKKFIPGEQRNDAEPAWQAKIMGAIASRCQEALANRKGTLDYLVNHRHLPNDIAWLIANGVGAVPDALPIKHLKEKAEKILTAGMELAYAAAKSPAEIVLLKEKKG